ncbi:MAG: hypothetical protein WBN24_12750 [Acidimicrobiia bacterium]
MAVRSLMIAASAGECGGIVKDLLARDQAVGMWIEAVRVSSPEFEGGEALKDDFGGVVGQDTMLDGYSDDSTLLR